MNILSKEIRGICAWMFAGWALLNGPVNVSGEVLRGVAMANETARSALVVSLELRMNKNEPIMAHLKFTNTSDKPYKLLFWLTLPGGRIDTKNYFKVTMDGEPVAYIGILKKRDPPTASDFIDVKPGEELASVVSLSDAYSIKPLGTLFVVYSAFNPSLLKDVSGERLESNSVSMEVRGMRGESR